VNWYKQRDTFKHEYLLLTVEPRTGVTDEKPLFYLRIERDTASYGDVIACGRPTDDIGAISCNRDAVCGKSDRHVATVDSRSAKTVIPLSKVKSIMETITKSGPKYVLWSTMCWWFARTCMRYLTYEYSGEQTGIVAELRYLIQARLELASETFKKGRITLPRLADYCVTPISVELASIAGKSMKGKITLLSRSILGLLANLGSFLADTLIPDEVWQMLVAKGWDGVLETYRMLRDIIEGKSIPVILAEHWGRMGIQSKNDPKLQEQKRNRLVDTHPWGITQTSTTLASIVQRK
jgi:hypothetical protein